MQNRKKPVQVSIICIIFWGPSYYGSYKEANTRRGGLRVREMWLKCNIAEKLICWKLLLPEHWVIQGFCGPEELDRVSTPNISKNNISVLFLFKMLAGNQTFADFVIFSSFHVMDELIYVTVALWHLKFFVKYSFSWNSVNFILAFFFFFF